MLQLKGSRKVSQLALQPYLLAPVHLISSKTSHTCCVTSCMLHEFNLFQWTQTFRLAI